MMIVDHRYGFSERGRSGGPYNSGWSAADND
jgi:hypothetical protein